MQHTRSNRTGVTLIELLVVLVLMGLVGALVVPALRTGPARPSEAIDAVIARVRDVAMADSRSLRLRVDPDGVWAVVPAAGGEPVLTGRLDPRSESAITSDDARRELLIDALGRCWPQRRATALEGAGFPSGARPFDMLTCREVTQ